MRSTLRLARGWRDFGAGTSPSTKCVGRASRGPVICNPCTSAWWTGTGLKCMDKGLCPVRRYDRATENLLCAHVGAICLRVRILPLNDYGALDRHTTKEAASFRVAIPEGVSNKS